MGIFAQMSRGTKLAILAGCLGILVFVFIALPLHQEQSYHSFADRRAVLGIPDFWDVISNFPFLIVGLMGLISFRDFGTRVLFLGGFLHPFGSGYYHLAPDQSTPFLGTDCP